MGGIYGEKCLKTIHLNYPIVNLKSFELLLLFNIFFFVIKRHFRLRDSIFSLQKGRVVLRIFETILDRIVGLDRKVRLRQLRLGRDFKCTLLNCARLFAFAHDFWGFLVGYKRVLCWRGGVNIWKNCIGNPSLGMRWLLWHLLASFRAGVVDPRFIIPRAIIHLLDQFRYLIYTKFLDIGLSFICDTWRVILSLLFRRILICLLEGFFDYWLLVLSKNSDEWRPPLVHFAQNAAGV